MRPRNEFIDSTILEEEPPIVPNCATDEPLCSLVYIDDFNTVEKIAIREAQSHISTSKRALKALAPKSEIQFERVGKLAEEIQMKVNYWGL